MDRHTFTHNTTEVEQSTSIPRYKTEIWCSCKWSAVAFTSAGAEDMRLKHLRSRNEAV